MNGPPARDQKLAPGQLTGCPPDMIRVVFLCIGGGSLGGRPDTLILDEV